MTPRYPLLAALLAISLPAQADTLYKCKNAEGRVTYTNQKIGKSCQIVAQDRPVSTFSALPPRTKSALEESFPRVGGEQQKARDDGRRAILEQELANEQNNLEAAKKALAEQEEQVMPDERIAGGGIQGGKREARIQSYRDKLQLHERNIESIRREIANLK